MPGRILSAKVLVADLHDLTQPLIRYDSPTGSPGRKPRHHQLLRASIDGRTTRCFLGAWPSTRT